MAAAALLFSVSTIVAFRGWPGVDGPLPSAGDDRITVATTTGQAASFASNSRRIVLPAAAKVARRRASTPRVLPVGATTAANVVSRPRAAVRRRIPDSMSAPAAAKGGPPAEVLAQRKREPAPAGDGVREVGSGISDTVGGVAGGLGDAVRPVSPALGRTLDQAGRSLEQTIAGAAEIIGVTVDALLAGAPPG